MRKLVVMVMNGLPPEMKEFAKSVKNLMVDSFLLVMSQNYLQSIQTAFALSFQLLEVTDVAKIETYDLSQFSFMVGQDGNLYVDTEYNIENINNVFYLNRDTGDLYFTDIMP